MANVFANIPVPAADGVGAIVDISAIGAPLTFIARGDYLGGIVVSVEVSEEAAGPDFFPLSFTFQESGEVEIGPETIRRIRSRVFGFTGGVPALDVAGSDTSGGGGGSAIAAPRDCFVFRPGAVAAENVYTSWPALVAALGIADGCKTIEFDDSIVSPIVIPVGGPYPMSDTIWSAGPNPATGAPTAVNVPEGVTFTNLRKFTGNLRVNNLAVATSPVSDFVTSDGVFIQDGATIENGAGTVAFFSGAALGPGDLIALILNDIGSIGIFTAGPVVDMPVAGTFLVSNVLDAGTVGTDTVSAVAGTLWLRAYNSSSASIAASQPSFLGSFFEIVLTRSRFNPNPAAPAAPAVAAVALAGNDLARLDSTAGLITQPLPLAVGLVGQLVAIKDFAVTGFGTAVPPAGADTIDGVVQTIPLAPSQSVVLVSDGDSDWIQIARGKPFILEASAVVFDTTVSPADVLQVGMTLTPGAGDYLVTYSTTLDHSANNQDIFFSVYVGGVQVARSERQFQTSSDPKPAGVEVLVTGVLAADAIELRWRTTGGTATAQQRTFTVVKTS